MSSIASIHGRTLRGYSGLGSALRNALACTLVAAATLYGPPAVRRHLKSPSISYMTAAMIVGEASTLGDAVKGAACALYGTALGLLPSTLVLHTMHPRDISTAAAAAAVAVSSFAVVAIDSTALITKRVALAQIVLVYVAAFKDAGHGMPLLDPVPVAASTAVGAVASVLALALPWPRLACFQASEKSEIYIETAKERLMLLANGICAENSACVAACASQAKSLGRVCEKVLQSLKLIQRGMQWERSLFKFLPSQSSERCELLQAIETPLKGMEMALSSSASSAPLRALDQQFKDALISQTTQISIKLGQDQSQIQDQTTEPSPAIAAEHLQHLPSLFFLFCSTLLRNAARSAPPQSKPPQDNKIIPTTEDAAEVPYETPAKRRSFKVSTERFVVALKAALSLSLAVLFGVMFNPENGKWSGLTVAIAFTTSGYTTFRSATDRAHGTALGSVYGVLGTLISQNLMSVRLLALLPWIVVATLLYRSRMYGPVGGFAAAVSAAMILGRRDYGPPLIFAVERLTETCVGLCCAVAFELLLQPERASSLARARLSESLGALRECLDSVASPPELKEREVQLRERVIELRKSISDAELEPNFWFLPFPVACYNKLHASLAKTSDFLLFMNHGIELLASDSREINDAVLKGYLEQYRNLTVSSVKCLEDALRTKSIASDDIETGGCPMHCSCFDEEECLRIADSFIRHAKTATEPVGEDGGGEPMGQAVLCLAAVGFCSGGLTREVKEMEKGVVELLQWENPYSHVNLHEISCRVKQESE